MAKHKRISMHYTPTSASWLNMVEMFFRDITENRLRRGVFTASVQELTTAIDEYVAHHKINPKPFIWTNARDILYKVIRANENLSSKQNGTLRLPARHQYGQNVLPTRLQFSSGIQNQSSFRWCCGELVASSCPQAHRDASEHISKHLRCSCICLPIPCYRLCPRPAC